MIWSRHHLTSLQMSLSRQRSRPRKSSGATCGPLRSDPILARRETPPLPSPLSPLLRSQLNDVTAASCCVLMNRKPFNVAVRREYLKLYIFKGQSLDEAFRFLFPFPIPFLVPPSLPRSRSPSSSSCLLLERQY